MNSSTTRNAREWRTRAFAFSSVINHEHLQTRTRRNRERVRQGDEHEQHTHRERHSTNKPCYHVITMIRYTHKPAPLRSRSTAKSDQ